MHRKGIFVRFAERISHQAGRPTAFVVAVLTVLIWALTGPVFRFSDTWQLVINTGTTVVTFLMVFLIQNTQNRDSTMIHIKLDELVRAVKGAHNALLDIDQLGEDELDRIRNAYGRLAARAREDLRHGSRDTGSPPVDGGGPDEDGGPAGPVGEGG